MPAKYVLKASKQDEESADFEDEITPEIDDAIESFDQVKGSWDEVYESILNAASTWDNALHSDNTVLGLINSIDNGMLNDFEQIDKLKKLREFWDKVSGLLNDAGNSMSEYESVFESLSSYMSDKWGY